MKVLFVTSGNKDFPIIPFIKSQGDSLIKEGIDLDYFLIKGKGIWGYFKNVPNLKKQIKQNDYDIIHAHYGLSGIVAALTFTRLPLVVSYMGSDTYGDYKESGAIEPKVLIQVILGKLLQPFADAIIVKSENLKKYIHFKKKTFIIPNGVDLIKMKPIDKKKARENLGFDFGKQYILFLGSPNEPRKNLKFLQQIQQSLNYSFEIVNPYPVDPEKIPLYMNACDVLALTSFNEGSPNVIKEAMACNCPIVATDVGDVRWVLDETKGCFITSLSLETAVNDTSKVLEFAKKNNRTNGRERIIELGLDNPNTARKIINVYSMLIGARKN